jgi:hypothetical protein
VAKLRQLGVATCAGLLETLRTGKQMASAQQAKHDDMLVVTCINYFIFPKAVLIAIRSLL